MLYTFIISFMKAKVNLVYSQAEDFNRYELAELIFNLQCRLDTRNDQDFEEWLNADESGVEYTWAVDVSHLLK